MKTYKQIISEVAEPIGGDEKAFKAKHVIQKINHPAAEDGQFTGGPSVKKDKSKKASYKEGEDEAVYEETDKEDDMCPECGESYDECECDGEEMEEAKMSDADMKQRENIVMGMKKSKADLQARYGDKWKSVMYATATKKAMEAVEIDEAKMTGNYARVMYDYREDYYNITVYKNGKEVASDDGYFGANETGNPLIKKFTDVVKKAGLKPEGLPIVDEDGKKGVFKGKFMWNTKEAVELDEVSAELAKKTYQKRMDQAKSYSKQSADEPDMSKSFALARKGYGAEKKAGQTSSRVVKKLLKKEAVELDEAFKAGEMKLADGSSVKLTNEDVSALNTLFKELNSANQKKMQERMMKDKKGFAEIVSFAKEAL
jgi:hypothetical protein